MRQRSATLLALLSLLLAACAGHGEGRAVYSGTIEAVEVDIVPEVAGRILERRVDEGDQVSAGDIVALVDPGPFRIALAEAEAALGQARARLALLRAGYREEEVRSAARDVDEASAQVVLAEAQLARAERLVSQEVGTQEDLDVARRDLDVARARLSSARARHDLLGSGYRPEEIDQAAADVERLSALLDRRRLDLDRTTVRSPLAGTVTQKIQEPGEYARIGSPIVTVADLANLYTWVYLTTTDLPRIVVGQAVSARIDAFPGEDFPGRVVYISPEAEFTPKNVQTVEDRVQLVFGVKVAVPNPDGRLKIGIPADIALDSRPGP